MSAFETSAAGLRVRTQSGAVEGTFRGPGNVDVGTGSSAIDLVGVNGGLTATSNSGRIRVSGLPTAPWQVTSGSGSFELDFDSNAKLTLDARSGSGSVRVDGSALQGSTIEGRGVWHGGWRWSARQGQQSQRIDPGRLAIDNERAGTRPAPSLVPVPGSAYFALCDVSISTTPALTAGGSFSLSLTDPRLKPSRTVP